MKKFRDGKKSTRVGKRKEQVVLVLGKRRAAHRITGPF